MPDDQETTPIVDQETTPIVDAMIQRINGLSAAAQALAAEAATLQSQIAVLAAALKKAKT